MAEQRQSGEKDEKPEKQNEKQEKQGQSLDEKWQRDPLSAVVWALILIWAGVVFLVGPMLGVEQMAGIGSWGLILAGAGVILLLEVLVRLLIPEYRRPVVGTVILALVLLGIGIGELVNWGVIWGIVLVAIGVSVLVGGLARRR